MKRFNQNGFSLIELMVVIAIVGIVAALASTKLKDFQRSAKQTEAKLNVNILSNLIKPYLSDGNSVGNGATVSGTDTSSPTSCYVANNFGFRLTDCTKINYQYIATGNAENLSSAFGAALEIKEGGVSKIFRECATKDVWAGGDGKLTQMSSPKTNCSTSLFVLWASKYGASDGSFDLDGDGWTTGSEFLILQRVGF